MKISLAPSVLTDSKWFPILDVILLIVEEGKHSFSADTAAEIMASDWISKREIAARELVRMSVTNRSFDRLADHSTVTIDASCRRGGRVDFLNCNTSIHPLDAIFFLSTPFQVIVENEYYDGAFILWMAKALGFEKLIRAYRQGRFVFRHAGGKGSLARSAILFSKGVWGRRTGDYDRAFRMWTCVVLDNDARYPGDIQNSGILTDALPYVSFVHELRRRAIESYIPQEKLKRFLDRNFFGKVDALFRFSSDQRRHFHMKTGFKFDKDILPTPEDYQASDKVSPQEKVLFGNIQRSDWVLVMEGFGSKLSKIYVEEQYRPNFNDASLVDPSDREELLELLENIYKRI